jgi:hypothetical protein
MSCLQRCKKRRQITRDATGTEWRTLYDPLIRHVTTFLDYKDAFAVRRVAGAARCPLSHALFERPGGGVVNRLYMPMTQDGTTRYPWKDADRCTVGGVATVPNTLAWSATTIDDNSWDILLRQHEVNMTAFACKRLPCIIEVDLGPHPTCMMCVHSIYVPAKLQLTQAQYNALERLVVRTVQNWRTTHDNLVQWRLCGLGRLMLCTAKRVQDEQTWKTRPLNSDGVTTNDSVLTAGIFDAASWRVPSESFPLPARLLNSAFLRRSF